MSQITKKMQIKPQWNVNSDLLNGYYRNIKDIHNCWRHNKKDPCKYYLWKCKLVNSSWKIAWKSLKTKTNKNKNKIKNCGMIHQLHTHIHKWKVNWNQSFKNKSIFRLHYSIIHNSQNMEQSKCSSMGKSIKHVGYKHKYYLTIK